MSESADLYRFVSIYVGICGHMQVYALICRFVQVCAVICHGIMGMAFPTGNFFVAGSNESIMQEASIKGLLYAVTAQRSLDAP